MRFPSRTKFHNAAAASWYGLAMIRVSSSAADAAGFSGSDPVPMSIACAPLTPCDAGGTGVEHVQRRWQAIEPKILQAISGLELMFISVTGRLRRQVRVEGRCRSLRRDLAGSPGITEPFRP